MKPTTKRRTMMKLRMRVNSFRKQMWSLGVLAAVVAGLATQPANAQLGQEEGKSMVGSWRVTVNVTDPQGVPSFPVLMTFHPDGTVLQSRPSYIPAFGVLETTQYGAWKRIGEHQAAATTLALAQGAPGNAALNGAFFGTETVSFQLVISAGGNFFTAQWTSTVHDPNGNLIVSGSGNMSGVRIQVEGVKENMQ